MGYGNYTSKDWSLLKTSRNINEKSNVNEIFSKGFSDKYDPRYISVRESRESAEHPLSTPIIIGLDDTASMGYLSERIATTALNETMMKLYSENVVPNPQLMFAFYGDEGDSHPLQVTQFESDIRIAEQLMELKFENHGHGCVVPSLLWLFADKFVVTDKWEKHHEKGFIFTIGDSAAVRPAAKDSFIDQTFGVNRVKFGLFQRFLNVDNIIKETGQKFEMFHFIICSKNEYGNLNRWNALYGRTVMLQRTEIDCIPELIISIIQYTLGADKSEILKQSESDYKREVVEKALNGLKI